MQALNFIVRTLLELYTLAFLLRFVLQWARADFHNPLSQFILQVTNPVTRPVRRFIPGWRGIDLSTLLIAYLLNVATIAGSYLILGGSFPDIPSLLLAALIGLVVMFLRMFVFLIIGQVLLSWFAPYHPISGILRTLTGPILGPIQRIVPPIAGIDLSPLFALIGIQALLLLVSGL
ncbi:MAG: YggT family protein [Gammaproteobacteria bacterium]|nr:YggT family protein [Gammaproteobacteria bacterium]MDH3767183.1 YggT family protein [Gammaproteobacteria bacterium]